jgi:hypothetical protein
VIGGNGSALPSASRNAAISWRVRLTAYVTMRVANRASRQRPQYNARMSRMLVLLAIPACTGGMADSSTIERGACVVLEGRQFSSVNELECGLTPDGVARCKWQLSFTAGDPAASEFTWSYSDVGEAGRASCDHNTVTAVGGREISGRFDPITQRLTWDGQVYVSN